jgi:hypothetical protein
VTTVESIIRLGNVLKRIWYSQTCKLSNAHIISGIFVTLVSFALSVSLVANLIYTLLIALAHEQADGDLLINSNHPIPGLIDILAFLPGPILALIVSKLIL